MEHWDFLFQIAGIIFLGGVAVATLRYVCKEVQELKAKVETLDARESYRHQHTLIVLTMLAACQNPDNQDLTTAIENLASNKFSGE